MCDIPDDDISCVGYQPAGERPDDALQEEDREGRELCQDSPGAGLGKDPSTLELASVRFPPPRSWPR